MFYVATGGKDLLISNRASEVDYICLFLGSQNLEFRAAAVAKYMTSLVYFQCSLGFRVSRCNGSYWRLYGRLSLRISYAELVVFVLLRTQVRGKQIVLESKHGLSPREWTRLLEISRLGPRHRRLMAVVSPSPTLWRWRMPDELVSLFMTAISVRQEHPVLRMRRDETIAPVGTVGWDRKSAFDSAFCLR